MGLPKGCQCYLGPFGAKVLFFTSLIVILTTLHNLVVKPILWKMLLPPAKLELEHDQTIFDMTFEKVRSIQSSTNHSKAANYQLVVVTAASSNFYPQLVNFIGSVHLWETSLKILVYDLGLNPPQLRELSAMQKVVVKPFPFHKPSSFSSSSSSSSSASSSSSSPFSTHIRDLRTGAFKPFVIADALRYYPKLVFMDAGSELWSTLDHVVDALKADGYFFVRTLDKSHHETSSGNVGDGSTEPLNNDISLITDSVQGYVRDSIGCKNVLEPLVKCQLHLNCSLFNVSFDVKTDGLTRIS